MEPVLADAVDATPSRTTVHTLTETLHSPFLTLVGRSPSALAAHAPLLAYERLDADESTATMQRVLSSSFRANLLRQVPSRGWALSRPEACRSDRRSDEWHNFCDRFERSVAKLASRDLAKRDVRLFHLCLVLGFHATVVEELRTVSLASAGDDTIAALLYLRALAASMLRADGRASPIDAGSDRRAILQSAQRSSRVRFYTASAELVRLAKSAEPRTQLGELREIMTGFVEQLPSDDDATLLDRSRYFRAVSFVPFLAGDYRLTTAELALAEDLARQAVVAADNRQPARLVALDNLHAVLESRMREALRIGDTDAALQRITEVTQFDQYDSKAHFERGEVLLLRGDLQAAIASFRRAVSYGPPGTQVAWFMIGHCLEQIGDYEQALDAYVSANELDPLSPSTLSGLRRVAQLVRRDELVSWAGARLGRLGNRDQTHRAHAGG